MSEEYLMSSADQAAAANSVAWLMECWSAWEMIDGPRGANFSYRRRQSPDTAHTYTRMTPFPSDQRSAPYAFPVLGVLVPAAAVVIENFANDGPHSGCIGGTPATHRIVWRERPEIRRIERGWQFYMRLGLMPLDAWLLEELGD
jgi:hypothetical protein